MVEQNIRTSDKPNNNSHSELALRQQGVDYARPMGVAPSAPCDVSTVTITSTRLLRLPELLARLHVCRATIYLHISKGMFPKPIAISPRAVGWLEHEVDAWLAAKMKARHGKSGDAFAPHIGYALVKIKGGCTRMGAKRLNALSLVKKKFWQVGVFTPSHW